MALSHQNILSFALSASLFMLGLGSHDPCHAGGGPENVLLVVNQNSEDSLTVSNYYSRLRDLPAKNVVYLDWQGSLEWTTRVEFRDKILKPVLEAIETRGLSAQIDYVVYSCDFPWAVKCQDLFPDLKGSNRARQMASLTGATYLFAYVLQDTPALMGLANNWYVPDASTRNVRQCAQVADAPSQGFRFRDGWERGGKESTDPKKGQHYLLSCMLGVTQARSNTVEEIARYLVASAAADGTRPDGAFYYMENGDIRSKTRHACFQAVAEQLREEGAQARVLKGKLPKGARDVAGVTIGTSKFDLPAANMRLLPGAIGENLTSFGGDFRPATGQTTLCEFLRAGAAGASGTVIEPFAIQAKFPLPSIHLHYYRGCSLAEAFYQSVSGPYQLLIVGDPLCQPWAKPPTCRSQAPKAGPVSGELTLRPMLSADAAVCELYFDGKLRGQIERGQGLKLDTTEFTEGYHELRLVAVKNDPIETRGREVVEITIDNDPAEHLVLLTHPAQRVQQSQKLKLRALGDDAEKVVFMHNSRLLGRAAGADHHLEVDAKELGRGPVRLIAANPVTGAQSPPVWVWVE